MVEMKQSKERRGGEREGEEGLFHENVNESILSFSNRPPAYDAMSCHVMPLLPRHSGIILLHTNSSTHGRLNRIKLQLVYENRIKRDEKRLVGWFGFGSSRGDS